MLYTINFTTQKRIKSLDKKGRVTSETQIDTPICMTGLPYPTAMSYAKCDNFTLVPDQVEQTTRRKTQVVSGMREAPGRSRYASEPRETYTPKAAKAPVRSAISKAAESGNLAEALNQD